MADENKSNPSASDIFSAWNDGFERGKSRFLTSMGKGGGGGWADSLARPKERTKPEVKAKPAAEKAQAKPAARPLVQPRQLPSPAQQAPITKGSQQTPGQMAIVDPWRGEYAQPGGKGMASPSDRFDPYDRAATGVSDWLRSRGYNTEQMASYITAGNQPGVDNGPPLTSEDMATLDPRMQIATQPPMQIATDPLKPNTDFDSWWDARRDNPVAGY